jgi:hypothetical protein
MNSEAEKRELVTVAMVLPLHHDVGTKMQRHKGT